MGNCKIPLPKPAPLTRSGNLGRGGDGRKAVVFLLTISPAKVHVGLYAPNCHTNNLLNTCALGATHLSPHLHRQMEGHYNPIMSKKRECRLAPINRAYLKELAKTRRLWEVVEAGVMRRLVENGIRDALEKGIIGKRSIEGF